MVIKCPNYNLVLFSIGQTLVEQPLIPREGPAEFRRAKTMIECGSSEEDVSVNALIIQRN